MALLRVEPGLLIWLWIAFGLIVVVLRFTVWDKITGGLDARSNRIASDLDGARQANEEAKRLVEEAKAKIEEAKQQGAVIVEQARYQASTLREQLAAEARAAVESERKKATREIAQERDDAVAQLRQEVVAISLEAARAVLKREVSASDHKELLDELLERFPAHN